MAPAPAKVEESKYRTLGLTATPLGAGQTLVRSEMTGAARVLAPQQADLLFACRTSDTLNGLRELFEREDSASKLFKCLTGLTITAYRERHQRSGK